jgi:hypothetical protein
LFFLIHRLVDEDASPFGDGVTAPPWRKLATSARDWRTTKQRLGFHQAAAF